jgi:hypothetical protein
MKRALKIYIRLTNRMKILGNRTVAQTLSRQNKYNEEEIYGMK